jgi:hypothetical protein
MTFASNHAAVDPDPVKELMRRRSLWAAAPGENGASLEPDASIVPVETINAAIKEIITWRLAAGEKGAGDLAEQFYDT